MGLTRETSTRGRTKTQPCGSRPFCLLHTHFFLKLCHAMVEDRLCWPSCMSFVDPRLFATPNAAPSCAVDRSDNISIFYVTWCVASICVVTSLTGARAVIRKHGRAMADCLICIPGREARAPAGRREGPTRVRGVGEGCATRIH